MSNIVHEEKLRIHVPLACTSYVSSCVCVSLNCELRRDTRASSFSDLDTRERNLERQSSCCCSRAVTLKKIQKTKKSEKYGKKTRDLEVYVRLQ